MHKTATAVLLTVQWAVLLTTGAVPAIKSEATAIFAPQDGHWVGWLVRYLDIYLFYVYASHQRQTLHHAA